MHFFCGNLSSAAIFLAVVQGEDVPFLSAAYKALIGPIGFPIGQRTRLHHQSDLGRYSEICKKDAKEMAKRIEQVTLDERVHSTSYHSI